jgi:hypothetical protein
MRLDSYDVSCLRAFLTVDYFELYALTFSQRLVAFASDRSVVGEYIGATFALNKTEAFVFVKPLNSSGNFV